MTWLSLLVVALCGFVFGQQEPEFRNVEDGQVRVVIPGFPGVDSVVLTISGRNTEQLTVTAVMLADGQWIANIPDVNDDVIQYVIEYQLQHGLHYKKGEFNKQAKERSVDFPVSKRHLERRATTVFYDDFSSGQIDPHKWSYTIYSARQHANEFQLYSPESVNTYIKNGVLYIRPTLTVDTFGEDFLKHGHLDLKARWGRCDGRSDLCVINGYQQIPPVMSARIHSSGHIRYGKVEVVAKLPIGDWLWPAIWMMPTENHYGPWPRSGEIDIMESRGNLHYRTHAGAPQGVDVEFATVHFGTKSQHHKSYHGSYQLHGSNFGQAFHTYWLDWTEDYLKIGVDDHTVVVMNTPAHNFWQDEHFHGDSIWASGGKNAPFDKPFYLILNVAVGGNYFSSYKVNEPYPQPWHDRWANSSVEFWEARHLWQPTWHGEDVAMKIKSVKMQQY